MNLFNSQFEIVDGTFIKCKGIYNNSCLSIGNNDGITTIGALAFKGNKRIERLSIGKNILDIGAEAFSCCSNLTVIEVDEDNPRFSSMNGSNCIIDKKTNCLIVGCSTTKIPENITSIGPFAFCGQTKLKEIEIPSSVKKLCSYSFDGCESLQTVSISDGLEEMYEYCFKQCASLKEISLPKTLTIISSKALGYSSKEYHEEVSKYTEDYMGYIDEEKIQLLSGCESIRVIHYSGTKKDFITNIDLSSILSPKCCSELLERVVCIDGCIEYKFNDDTSF